MHGVIASRISVAVYGSVFIARSGRGNSSTEPALLTAPQDGSPLVNAVG